MYKGNNTISSVIKGSSNIAKILFNGIEVWRKSLLPYGYVLCDYLESTGTQYIDTGYIPTINTDIKTKASVQYNAGSTPVALFGYLSGNDPYNRYAIQYHKDIIYCAKGKIEATNDTIDYTKMCDIETQGDKYIYNGIEMSVAPLDFSVSNNLSIILFARQTTNVNRHSKSKIEFFKIYEKSVLVQDLIPCLDNNGIPCMYDTVSGKTFYNQGTGIFKFKIKVQIPDGYALCDYLESTGTQYIDTGFIPTNKSKSIVDMQCTDWATMRANFFGAGDYTRNARFNLGMNTAKTYFQWNIADKYFDNIRVKTTDRVTITMDAINHSITFGTETIIKNTPNYDLINDGTFTFWLFQASGAYNSYCKIFSCKIYDDNKLVLYMIPCLDDKGVPCMYDLISKQSFYNQGTGEFKWSINPTYLQLKDFAEGFVNSSTGAVAPNSTYPRAISSPLVLFEKGKTYKVTSNLSATQTDDGVRFRIYGTDDTYKMSLGASQITTNAYATFEALDDAGKANFYVAKDILITPKQDFKARIMYIDKNYISEFKLEEI